MKLLITGASGFIGSALVERLVKVEHSDVCMALRSHPQSDPGYPFAVVGDLSPDNDWRQALRGCSHVVHCAARVHVMDDPSSDPLTEFRRANVEGTMNLARQAAEAGVKRFIFISSIKVNGEQTANGQPFSADDSPAPIDPYGVSKHEAEQGLLELANKTDMEVVIIRPPLVYGPGVKANFAKMINFVAKGVPLPLGAVRNNRRSLVALDNLVDLIVKCLEHPAAANQVFLAGDGEDLSTSELLQRIAQSMNKRPRLIPVPLVLMEVAATLLGKKAVVQRLFGSLQVDITKTCELLDWAPPVSVNEGLKRAVAPMLSGKGDLL